MPGYSAKAIARIEALTWLLIYVGLLALVLGLAAGARDTGVAIWLVVVGAALAVAGAVLIFVRSRMDVDG